MNKDSQKQWFVYIVKCADESLYTGITTNISKRIKNHNTGTGAKYTKVRTPVYLVYKEIRKNRSQASKREIEIKKLRRIEKLILISNSSNHLN